jgi:hypothetical protein
MIQLLKDALSSPAGSFGFVFALMVLGGWIIHWVTRKVTLIQADHGTLTKSVSKIETSIDDIRVRMSFMEGSINILDSNQRGGFTKSHSPISLTDEGVKVAVDIKAEEIISHNWPKIFAILESAISNKNAYDIQQYCIENVSVDPDRFIDNDSLNRLKDYAYAQGKPLQMYTRLMGVLIRDRYLRLKGIAAVEIDKHDPNANKNG